MSRTSYYLYLLLAAVLFIKRTALPITANVNNRFLALPLTYQHIHFIEQLTKNQMNKLLSPEQILSNPEIYIKWMCYNLLITVDNQVFNLSMYRLKEQLIGGSYCFYCNGKYRSKKWIRGNCIDVLGFITD